MNLRGVALLAPLCERLSTGMERSSWESVAGGSLRDSSGHGGTDPPDAL